MSGATSALLLAAAVPFSFPEEDRSLAARRHRARRLRQHMQQPHVRQQVERHILLATTGVVAAEAAEAVERVARGVNGGGGGPVYDARRDFIPGPIAIPQEQTPTYPQAPPNSPNDRFSFTFPDDDDASSPINKEDGLQHTASPTSSSTTSSTSPDEFPPRSSRGRRSQRKRRRAPSFKKKDHRVQPKVEAHEADDEASEDEGAKADQVDAASVSYRYEEHVRYITRQTGQMSCQKKDGEEEDQEEEESDEDVELRLKLKVWSQVQRTVEELLNAESKSEDWARAGRELRHIADKFTSGGDPPPPPPPQQHHHHHQQQQHQIQEQQEQQQQLAIVQQVDDEQQQQQQQFIMHQQNQQFVMHQHQPHDEVPLMADGILDLPTLFNAMLPFSLPRPLWIALINWGCYKAYKIFSQ